MKQLKKILPNSIVKMLRNVKLFFIKNKSVEDVFTETYLKKKWGEKVDRPFFSGYGSIDNEYKPYIEIINAFIKDNNIKNIVDLGCGDFEVGNKLSKECNYIGCDVVTPLIEYNNKKFANEKTSFIKCNIISDNLPEGDLCLIRQVFQHLSNDNILVILKKIKKYKFIIIADAQPNQDNVRINKDMPNFSGTRAVIHGTGLWLENSPFNQKVQVLLEYPLCSNDNEYLRIIRLE